MENSFIIEDLLGDSLLGSIEVVFGEGLFQLQDQAWVLGLHDLRKLFEVVLEENQLRLDDVVSEGDVLSHVFVTVAPDLQLQKVNYFVMEILSEGEGPSSVLKELHHCQIPASLAGNSFHQLDQQADETVEFEGEILLFL